MRSRPYVTIGIFDGVHLGHKKAICSTVRRARRQGREAVAITFNPHPLKVICKKMPPLLLSLKHRVKLIEQLGIDRCIVLNFTKRLSKLTALEFVKRVLVKRLKAEAVFVGEDFVFGKGARADVDRLKLYGKKFGFDVTALKLAKYKKRHISSSLIRSFIEQGRFKEAAKLLGRPVTILGTVVKGDRRGRILGFPTANVNPHHEAVPPPGVYAVKVIINKREHSGILNIGIRPTFYGWHKQDIEPLIEVHIFNFSKKIYGKEIEIQFLQRLRPEKKFKDRNELVKQIKRDVKKVKREFFSFQKTTCR